MVPRRRLPRLCQLSPGRSLGKLKAAARAWVFALLGRADPTKPAPVDVEGFAALGVQAAPRSAEEDVFTVWDINAAVLDLFLTCQGSWRVLSSGRSTIWLGLDYSAVDVVMRRLSIEDADGVIFSGLLTMEEAAIDAFAEVR